MQEMVAQSDDSIERPSKSWKYPYVAGVVDFGTNFRMSIGKAADTKVGYRISPALYISSTDKRVLGFLDEFCDEHGITPKLREKQETFRLELTVRSELEQFLQLVRPYVITRDEAVTILLDNIIPMLDDGLHSEKSGFVRIMYWVDKFRDHTTQRSEPKYTQAYFEDEWDL